MSKTTTHRPSKLQMIACIAAVSVGLISGCGPRRDTTSGGATATFEREESTQRVVMIVMDLSGSFTDKMAEDGEAYEFALHVIDRYFRRRDPMNDRIILAQISGMEQSLLWEGSPLELRRKFPNAGAFRDFLLANADTSGSLVHDAVANAISYLTLHPKYGGGDAKTATLILSDMEDTGSSDSEQHLSKWLEAYGSANGAVGVYFCDQHRVEDWKDRLTRAGIDNFIVESEIVGKPQLPNFE